ncbi:MAG: 1,6-anhydro-N-acetylmuramyl-L-alanine amidase AmpD [Halieaceae bacterium]|jgi:AmpD protein|nr:1,6-anhydro-N-acetylmuramyl-L-alanine amidase AmpD [Halieaceae bacterium]
MTTHTLAAGWLDSAARCPSPNCNARPQPADISLLVIHNISLPPGEYGTGCVQQFFCNQLDCDAHPYFDEIRGMEVSSHLLIERDGAVTQFVSLADRAWHAGVSSFEGRDNCNDFSIGIELEGCDTEAYTDAQYAALAAITGELMRAYPAITRDRITGHSDIAPGRKTDPGPAFDWAHFRELLDREVGA